MTDDEEAPAWLGCALLLTGAWLGLFVVVVIVWWT
jgi:hypothetical protein